MKTIQYLKYIFRHKWFVFLECYRLGIIWRGIWHDMSKFLPSEFFAYREYFYGNPDAKETEAFDFAWHWHIRRNKHHWQWWILKFDNGGLKIFEMPVQYRKEMIADWIGAGKAIHGKDNLKLWYQENRDKIALAPETRKWVENWIEQREIPKQFAAV